MTRNSSQLSQNADGARESDIRLIDECDARVRAQWRRRGLDYAADVVEALRRELRRAEREGQTS